MKRIEGVGIKSILKSFKKLGSIEKVIEDLIETKKEKCEIPENLGETVKELF